MLANLFWKLEVILNVFRNDTAFVAFCFPLHRFFFLQDSDFPLISASKHPCVAVSVFLKWYCVGLSISIRCPAVYSESGSCQPIKKKVPDRSLQFFSEKWRSKPPFSLGGFFGKLWKWSFSQKVGKYSLCPSEKRVKNGCTRFFHSKNGVWRGVFCKDSTLMDAKKLQGYTCYVCKKFSTVEVGWIIWGSTLIASFDT